jgi:hypothetical protein
MPMYSKEPVWLSPNEVIKKYFNVCNERKIHEKFLARLYDAHLLRGKINRKTKKIELLEESWLDLLLLINHNLHSQLIPLNGEPIKIYAPKYYHTLDGKLITDSDKTWYTPSELLNVYDFLEHEKIFTVEFVGSLSDTGILRGHFNNTEKCRHILLPSFNKLLEYREHTIVQNLFFPNSLL